ncbi:MAG: hypothetical protein KDE47_17555 [Caldilineaceae bacterium]|nr:hypothetical protein [Caldilineaceae bacterium]
MVPTRYAKISIAIVAQVAANPQNNAKKEGLMASRSLLKVVYKKEMVEQMFE